MGLGDFGLCPVLPTPSKRFCTPIKNGEYWALGLPVVITPRISDDSERIVKHRAGVVWDHTGPPEPAVEALAALLAEPEAARRARIREVAASERSFSISEAIYRQVYGGA
jgi:glycosyltransferase involved in cell wall biosynthesis